MFHNITVFLDQINTALPTLNLWMLMALVFLTVMSMLLYFHSWTLSQHYIFMWY